MAAGRKYTVVWICAITTEYAAACQFLDETHDKPDWVGINDDGEYTLGSVGGHNVVVVAMTRGEYGLASATGSVKDALRSFPDVRFGLMVGVGGGAPSPRHDVRLGDVVVGVPPAGAGDEGEGVQGGVFQYDYGENVQGERFRHTGCVYQAPAILRAAVDVLRAEYDAGEEGKRTHRWLGEAVEEVLARRPRLRGRFGRPDASEDRLYKPETLHPLGGQGRLRDALRRRPGDHGGAQRARRGRRGGGALRGDSVVQHADEERAGAGQDGGGEGRGVLRDGGGGGGGARAVPGGQGRVRLRGLAQEEGVAGVRGAGGGGVREGGPAEGSAAGGGG